MAMTVKKRMDVGLPRVLMHKVADIRGGVSVKASELGGGILLEGAVLSVPEDGLCHVVKVARVVEANATGKTIKVKKYHTLQVGDIVMLDEGGKAFGITKIDASNSAYDVVEVKTALGAVKEGDCLVEAKAESTGTTSALKYVPLSVAGTSQAIDTKSNLIVDAWVIGVTAGNALPECIAKHLKGIVNV